MHTGYCWESQKEGDHWEDQDVGEWTVTGTETKLVCIKQAFFFNVPLDYFQSKFFE
jgi:hypothetical protein